MSIKIVRLVAHALMALGVAACVGAAESEVQQGVTYYYPWVGSTKATYVNSASPTSNYGSATAMYVKNNQPKRSLVQFDLAAIAGATQCQELLGADLYLPGVNGRYLTAGQTINAHRITESWTESGATWNKRDASNNWSTAGGSYSSVVSGTGTTGAGSVFIDVTSDLLAMKAGTMSNFGWLLKDATESGSVRENAFASDEAFNWSLALSLSTKSTCPNSTCSTVNGIDYLIWYTCSSGQCIAQQDECFYGCYEFVDGSYIGADCYSPWE